MKYKIQKFADGGNPVQVATFVPFITPVDQTIQKTTSEKSDGGLMDEKLYEKLAGAGLVNDVNQFAAEMSALKSDPFSMFSTPTNSYLTQIAKVNELIENKKAWDSAVKTSESTGGYGEVAIGKQGELYTRNGNGNIIQIDLKTYKQNKDNVKLLSVAELLNARNFEKQLTKQNGVFDVANNSVGLDKITSHIKELIGTLAEESETTERHYSSGQVREQLGKEIQRLTGSKQKPSEADLTALRTLKEIAATPGEFYKVVNENTSKKNHLDKALNFIWGTLNEGAKKKLEVAAAMNNVDNPKEMIVDMLNAGTSAKIKSEISPEKNPVGDGDGSGKDSSKSLTQFQMFHNDKLVNHNSTFGLNDPKTSGMFNGTIGGVAPLMQANGDLIGMGTVKDILTTGGYGAFLKQNEVFFGNKKVSQYELNNMIYDGQDAAKVYMPIGRDGAPDYQSAAKFSEVNAVYEANKDKWDVSKAKEYFKQNGFNVNIEETYEGGKRTKVIKENAYVKPFLVFYGYTNDATSLVDNNDNLITELSSNEEDAIVPQLQSIWTVGTGKTAKNLTPDGWFGEDYYKGIIAIPYRDEAAAIVSSMVGQGPKEKVSNIADVQRNINNSSGQPLNRNVGGMALK